MIFDFIIPKRCSKCGKLYFKKDLSIRDEKYICYECLYNMLTDEGIRRLKELEFVKEGIVNTYIEKIELNL